MHLFELYKPLITNYPSAPRRGAEGTVPVPAQKEYSFWAGTKIIVRKPDKRTGKIYKSIAVRIS